MALAVAEHQEQIETVGFDERIMMPFGIQREVLIGKKMEFAHRPFQEKRQESRLQLRGVDAGYPGCRVHCADLKLAPGDVAHVSGENGSGKTGLLKALLGIAPAAISGGIQFAGSSMIDLSGAMRRAEVRYMSQSRDSFRSLRVADAMRVASSLSEVCDPLLLEAIASIGGHKRVSELSSGNLALLSLAQTLAVRPRLAVLDEPFANVDAANTVKMASMIECARQEFGTAFLIVEHGNIDWPGVAHYTVEQDGNRAYLRRER
jgi:ABC-type multidrug transport system ATPase subunit